MPTSKTFVPVVAAALTVGALTQFTSAGGTDSYHFTLQSTPSSVHTDLSAGATLAGTLLGNYVEKTNPKGTRTILGLIGPTSGNTPIPFSGTAGFTGQDTTHPAGAFNLTLDLDNNIATVGGLTLDLINGHNIGVTLGITIEYETFRTRQPTAIFLGNIPLPIPLGQVQLTALSLTQTGLAGAGVLTPTGPNQYSATLIAPVELAGSIDSLGQIIDIGPITIPLPLVLDVTLNGATAAATFSFDQSFMQELPLMLDLPADQPLDLPTILPPGSTAHLLVNGSIDGFSVDFTVTADLTASGARQTFRRADWNRDGVVNSMDYYAFTLQFMTIGADFNEDAAMDSRDYFDYVVVYFDER